MQHSEADGGLEWVGGGGKQLLYLGARYSLWESRVDAQTEAATSRRHYGGRAISSQAFPRNDDFTSPAL